MTHELVGKSYTFADGNKIEVIQVRERDEIRGGASVTFYTYQGPGIPAKLILNLSEFMNIYGHLFK
ncbi:MAG: hypothetical protein ACOVLB_03515 [Candidatus Nanopelagicus sp.]